MPRGPLTSTPSSPGWRTTGELHILSLLFCCDADQLCLFPPVTAPSLIPERRTRSPLSFGVDWPLLLARWAWRQPTMVWGTLVSSPVPRPPSRHHLPPHRPPRLPSRPLLRQTSRTAVDRRQIALVPGHRGHEPEKEFLFLYPFGIKNIIQIQSRISTPVWISKPKRQCQSRLLSR